VNQLPALKVAKLGVREHHVEERWHVGVSDHGCWAVLVTGARDGTLLESHLGRMDQSTLTKRKRRRR
jgi:hypothetical protein